MLVWIWIPINLLNFFMLQKSVRKLLKSRAALKELKKPKLEVLYHWDLRPYISEVLTLPLEIYFHDDTSIMASGTDWDGGDTPKNWIIV